MERGTWCFLQNLLLIIMLISHIRNRCIQSGRRDGESSALQCHTQPYNSGWLDPTPVIYFLSPGLSLCKMQMTLNFFMNFWGQGKPVSHPCGPSFCYCCSVHELDVLGPTSLPFWNSSSCKLCPPPTPTAVSFLHPEGINGTKHPRVEWLCGWSLRQLLGWGWEEGSYGKRTG